MTGRGLEIRVGAVVILASLIAVIGTMWFQKFQLAEKRYSFFVRFNEVGGLVSGDPIQINGVERGRVDSVALMREHVVVEMAVREDGRYRRRRNADVLRDRVHGHRPVVASSHAGYSACSVRRGK